MVRGSLVVEKALLLILLFSAIDYSRSNNLPAPRQSKLQFEVLSLTRSRLNHLTIRALINGREALLMVDTGLPVTVIASSKVEHFGLTSAPDKMSWPSRVNVNGVFNKLVLAPNIQLGTLELADVPVVVAEMRTVRGAARVSREPEPDGILGIDVLLATKAILDCQNQTLILDKTPSFFWPFPRYDTRGLTKIKFRVSDGLNSYVDGSINGAPAQLMIDTGTGDTLLHRPFVETLEIPLQRTRFRSATINATGDKVDRARIRKLCIGLVNIADKEVGVTNLQQLIDDEASQRRPVAGLLGAELLLSHHGIVDFGTKTLYLKQ